MRNQPKRLEDRQVCFAVLRRLLLTRDTFRLGVIQVHIPYTSYRASDCVCVCWSYVRSALSTITTRSVSAHVAFRRRLSNRVRDTFATTKRRQSNTRTSFQCALLPMPLATLPTFWVSSPLSCIRQVFFLLNIQNCEFCKNSKSKLLTLEHSKQAPSHTYAKNNCAVHPPNSQWSYTARKSSRCSRVKLFSFKF